MGEAVERFIRLLCIRGCVPSNGSSLSSTSCGTASCSSSRQKGTSVNLCSMALGRISDACRICSRPVKRRYRFFGVSMMSLSAYFIGLSP